MIWISGSNNETSVSFILGLVLHLFFLVTRQKSSGNDESPKDEPEIAVGTKCRSTAHRITQIHRVDLSD